ncbi:hypothetical protein IFM89_006705 [Coptis chinensis]|uniref:RDR1/2-like RRM domain-containing protein n=1 Tax=Coptis chinensis TaxID=261450 RepID=A0A835LLK1_9MAGN|nr:hypothetical protein IFM89_006705 [Coptis chinensis]
MSKTIQVSGLPSHVSAQVVKEFLERYAGEGTAFALKIRQSKSKGPNPRAFGKSPIPTTKGVETILSLARQCPYYGISCLKVHNMERDIVPKPRVMMLSPDVPGVTFWVRVLRESFKALRKGKHRSELWFWSLESGASSFSFWCRL